MSFSVPRTGTYRVRVFSKSGGAMTRVLHTASYDVAQVGYIYVPNEFVDAHHDYTRSYRLPALAAGGAINLELTWNDRNVDVDMRLYNKNGSEVASSRSVNNAERISYLIPPSEGPYKLGVESYSHLDAKFELRSTAPLLQ